MAAAGAPGSPPGAGRFKFSLRGTHSAEKGAKGDANSLRPGGGEQVWARETVGVCAPACAGKRGGAGEAFRGGGRAPRTKKPPPRAGAARGERTPPVRSFITPPASSRADDTPIARFIPMPP